MFLLPPGVCETSGALVIGLLQQCVGLNWMSCSMQCIKLWSFLLVLFSCIFCCVWDQVNNILRSAKSMEDIVTIYNRASWFGVPFADWDQGGWMDVCITT